MGDHGLLTYYMNQPYAATSLSRSSVAKYGYFGDVLLLSLSMEAPSYTAALSYGDPKPSRLAYIAVKLRVSYNPRVKP